MKETRLHRAKVNIASTLANQLMTTLCGILIPKIMIGAFGSVVYGATTSIAQFLSYISLFEGGIGSVARASLYKPLAKKDNTAISKVYQAIKRFFQAIGIAFIVYTLLLAVFYYDIAKITVFSREFTFCLVVVISISTLAKYLGGVANLTLINADQRQYITNTVIMATTVINTVLIVLFVHLNSSVLIVKLASSCVFVLRPLLFSRYVKKNYELSKVQKDHSVLHQKWTGLGQHMAYFLHTNTDVVILTLFADLRLVSVYSVYGLVIKSIKNITSSFSGGMEAAFGEMIAKNEQDALRKAYGRYKILLSTITTVLFGATAILIVPFVRLYMAGITDADYIQPIFALILLLAEAINCLVLPCSTLPVSANKLKETRLGAYGEAAINIMLSCILVFWNPLVDVAVGTLASAFFKSFFYMTYAAKHILRQNIWNMIRRYIFSLAMLVGISAGGIMIINNFQIKNFLEWFIAGVFVFAVVGAITVGLNFLLFPQDFKPMLNGIHRKIHCALKI